MTIDLKTLLENKKPYESDLDVIKSYFVANRIEEEGIRLMAELSENRVAFWRSKSSYSEEWETYLSTIFANGEMSDSERIRLHGLARTWFFFRDLDDAELEEAASLATKAEYCPLHFVSYLKSKGVLPEGQGGCDADLVGLVMHYREGGKEENE